MSGTGGDCGKRNKSEDKSPGSFTYTWNVGNKSKKQSNLDKKRVLEVGLKN